MTQSQGENSGRRVVHLKNPRDPSKPFAMVTNQSGVQWFSCEVGMGGGGGGFSGGGGVRGSGQRGSSITLPMKVFRMSGLTTAQQVTIQSNVDALNAASGTMLTAGGLLSAVGLAAIGAMGTGIIALGGGLVFLFGGIITMTLAQFVELLTFKTVWVVRFTEPCKGKGY